MTKTKFAKKQKTQTIKTNGFTIKFKQHEAFMPTEIQKKQSKYNTKNKQ
jgi:hypothetical protein